jgi:hypothetical protein
MKLPSRLPERLRDQRWMLNIAGWFAGVWTLFP